MTVRVSGFRCNVALQRGLGNGGALRRSQAHPLEPAYEGQDDHEQCEE